MLHTQTLQMIKTYAPYVYLTAFQAKQIYDLFLLVPVNAGECLEFKGKEEYPDGMIIHFDIISGNTDAILMDDCRFISKHFKFEHMEGEQEEFRPDEFEVTIVIHGRNMEIATMTVQYKDSDVIYHKNGIEKDMALNCPYIYLANPDDNILNPHSYSYPKMLVPTKGYRFLEPAEELTITGSKSGICENIVILAKDEQSTLQIIAPPKINKTRFRDLSGDGGDFCAITLLFDDIEEAWEFIEKSHEERNEEILKKERVEAFYKTKSEIRIKTRNADTQPGFTIIFN